ncbi:hypothetical protein LI328DRAFT_169764 [Trichoderma asperelloides]|nr:hypothetical protein LI328DRAFT_169764 [Trichoderma asperelloides]
MEYEDHCLQEPSAAICIRRDGQVPASLAQGYTVHTHTHGDRAEFGRRRLATRPHDREGGLSGAEFFFWTGIAVTAGMLGRCLRGTARRDLKVSGKGFHSNPRHRPVSCSSSWWRRWYSESHAHESLQQQHHILCTRHSCPHHRVILAARDWPDWPEPPSPPSGAEGTRQSAPRMANCEASNDAGVPERWEEPRPRRTLPTAHGAAPGQGREPSKWALGEAHPPLGP